jgi:uncharacterized YigZ family protein
MRSVPTLVQTEIVIQKSRFLGFLDHVESESEAKAILSKFKEAYPDATHHVFAYVIGSEREIQRASDAGEPSRTAGMPVMEVLQKQNLTDVIAIVIRYFGGIKLGAGGLIRAYANTAQALVEHASFCEKRRIDTLRIELSYSQADTAIHLLKPVAIRLDPVYKEKVMLEFDLPHDQMDSLVQSLQTALSATLNVILVQSVFRYA